MFRPVASILATATAEKLPEKGTGSDIEHDACPANILPNVLGCLLDFFLLSGSDDDFDCCVFHIFIFGKKKRRES